MYLFPLFLCILLAVILPYSFADIDPGSIGLQFFGNEYVYSQKIKSFPTTEFSLTLRIKGNSGSILSYGVQQSSQFDGSHFSLLSANALVINRGQGQSWSTGVNFADSNWHALGVTWKMSTGELKLYKDGLFVASSILSKGLPMSINGFLNLGQEQNCANGCFSSQKGFVGVLADITLWRRVLSPSQVQYLSTNSPSGDETDLVSFWPLYENNGLIATDKAIGSNTLFIGGPSSSRDLGMAESTSSISLRKFDAIFVSPQKDLPSGDFTIEFWIKTTSMDDTIILSYFLSAGSNTTFVIRNPAVLTLFRNNERVRTDTSFATGSWNHAAITWSQQTGRVSVYKNGALSYPPPWLPPADYNLMPTFNLGGTIPTRPTRLVFGNAAQCVTGSCLIPGIGFDGMIQEFRMWNTIRTQQQIQDFKDRFLPTDPVPNNLVLYLKMNDDANSNMIADSSGSGNDGTKNLPMWKNTMLAPPIPNLNDVNEQILNLRSQMSNIYDFVRDVLDPAAPIPKNETGFNVQNQGGCDRRYKYMCTLKTQPNPSILKTQTQTPTTTTTPTPTKTPTPKAQLLIQSLVEKSLEVQRTDSGLTQHLEPKLHVHKPNPIISSPDSLFSKRHLSQHVINLNNNRPRIELDTLIQQKQQQQQQQPQQQQQIKQQPINSIHTVYDKNKEDNNDKYNDSPSSPVAAATASNTVSNTDLFPDRRVRHSWSGSSQPIHNNNNNNPSINSLHSDLTVGQRKPRHAWATTSIEVIPQQINNDNNNNFGTEFLEEAESVILDKSNKDDYDDSAPENIHKNKKLSQRFAAAVKDGVKSVQTAIEEDEEPKNEHQHSHGHHHSSHHQHQHHQQQSKTTTNLRKEALQKLQNKK